MGVGVGVRDGGVGRWGDGGGGGGVGGEFGSTAPESGLPTSLRPVTAIQVIGYNLQIIIIIIIIIFLLVLKWQWVCKQQLGNRHYIRRQSFSLS